MQTPSLPYVDNSTLLPESLFGKAPDRAWGTFFIQDAKIDPTTQKMITCEFGLGVSSQWGLMGQEPFNRIVTVLNSHAPRVWLMASKQTVEANGQELGARSIWPKFYNAIKSNRNNILRLEDPMNKQKFPTSYKEEGSFDPHQLSQYYAIGIIPYIDLPAAHFADITGKHPNDPRIAILDEGPNGSVVKVTNYKHMTRLVMNGTDAAPQNPPYVIIETRYSPELASFLKVKFPNDQRLVLKHVASSRGEGVVILDASSQKNLDKELQGYLSDNSEFVKRNPLCICLIESFISTPENSSEKKMKETIVRVCHVVLQDNKKMHFYPVAATRCFEGEKSSSDPSTKGMVKLGKLNDGRSEPLTEKELGGIRERHFAEITAFAKRAVSYDPDAAVEYFLSSESHILNLIGIELFSPILTYNYREEVGQDQNIAFKRISEGQCVQFISLLERNKRPIIREKILKNILMPEIDSIFRVPTYESSPGLDRLLEAAVNESQDPSNRTLCRELLVDNLKNLYRGFAPTPHALAFQLKGLKLLSGFEEISSRMRFQSWGPILQVSSFVMSKDEGVDYNALLTKLPLQSVAPKTVDALTQLIQKKKALNVFDLYRYFLRLQKEECSFAKTWSQEEWNGLLSFGEKTESQLTLAAALWLLTEAMHLGWNPGQLLDVLTTYFKDRAAPDAFLLFGGMIRALSQYKEINPNVSYQFMKTVATFEADPACLIVLTRAILDKTLIASQGIDQVLVSIFQPLRHCISQYGPTRQVFSAYLKPYFKLILN